MNVPTQAKTGLEWASLQSEVRVKIKLKSGGQGCPPHRLLRGRAGCYCEGLRRLQFEGVWGRISQGPCRRWGRHIHRTRHKALCHQVLQRQGGAQKVGLDQFDPHPAKQCQILV